MLNPAYYAPIFFWGLFILCSLYSLKIYNYSNGELIAKHNNYNYAIMLAIILIFFLGLRPVSGIYFGDTANYAYHYNLISNNPELALYELFQSKEEDDWLFVFLMILFSRFADVSFFFLFVELIYIGCNLWACAKLFPNNPVASFLVVLSSFSFYSYGVNGIRNGMALALVTVVLTLIDKNFRNKIISFLLIFIAYNIHHSSALPSLMLLLSVFIVKDFKWALLFWISSIFISLFSGGAIANVFEGLGFDDRLSGYISGAQDVDVMESFSKTGFRWDFLLYSCIPIVIGYFVIIKKRIKNKTYELVLNTYTLSNAFWVMVIRASFSNRFAYLSWFLYPFVLAYPFLRMNIWQYQSKKAAIMIMGNILFSIMI